MADKKSHEQKEDEKVTDYTDYEVVDVSFDEVDSIQESDTPNEVDKEAPEPPIPEEWKGKPESEIILLREIQDLRKKLTDSENTWFDKYARLQAEFDNFRKRSLKDRENYICYASADLMAKLLPVLDSTENMLKSLEQKLEPDEFQGIEMFIKELFGVFEKEGLTPIKAKGELFDPFVHEIITIEYTDECPEETITEVFQKGYRLKDRVIRPCKVKIAKIKKVEKEEIEEKVEENKE